MAGRGAAWQGGMILAALSLGSAAAQEPPASAAAQGQNEAATPASDDYWDWSDEQIVVRANPDARPYGAVASDIEPEVSLDARDVRALGVANLGEVIEELSAQTASVSGREDGSPIILLNGRRIGNLREIQGYPPEAILRIDILPEEVALEFGFNPDQKVINVVLRRRFAAITVEGRFGESTDGGAETSGAIANRLTLRGPNRLSFDGDYLREDALFQSDRDMLTTRANDNFGIPGNLAAVGRQEIDPALSALAGETVTNAVVPETFAGDIPALEDFVAGANQAQGGDETPYRTLIPERERLELGVSWARPIADRTTVSSTFGLTSETTVAALGLPASAVTIGADNPFTPFAEDVIVRRRVVGLGPLERTNDNKDYEGALNFLGEYSSEWRWDATLSYTHKDREALTDQRLNQSMFVDAVMANDPGVNPFAPIDAALIFFEPADMSDSNTEDAQATASFNGPLFEAPAGNVRATLRPTLRYQDIDSLASRNGIEAESFLLRRSAGVLMNLDIPVARVRKQVLDGLGNLSLNANLEFERLSDVGSLSTYGTGFNWEPIRNYRFVGSWSHDETAASIEQLGEPQLVTPNISVFDYVSGERVDITRITGGNPELSPETRSIYRIGVTAEPFDSIDLTLLLNYSDTRTENPIAAFPNASAELEEALPGRFIRDTDGTLLQIDARRVNFAESTNRQLRWGFNYTKTFRNQAGAAATAGQGQREPSQQSSEGAMDSARSEPSNEGRDQGERVQRGDDDQGAARGRRRGGGFGGGGGHNARVTFNLYHTLRLEDTILIGPGAPELDLLAGSALRNRGGNSEHQVELEAGYTKSGLGARVSANWESGASDLVDRFSTTRSPGDLYFDEVGTVDLRLFVDFSLRREITQRAPILQGSRLSLSVDNVSNELPRAYYGLGETPLSLQSPQLDPRGRTVLISFRKVFLDRNAFSRPEGLQNLQR